MKYAPVLYLTLLAACATQPERNADSPPVEAPTQLPHSGPDIESVAEPTMPDDPMEGLTASVIAVDGVYVTIDSTSPLETPWLISDRHGGIGWVEVVRTDEASSVCRTRGAFETHPRPGHAAIIGERHWIESGEPDYQPLAGIATMPMAPHPFGPWTPNGAPVAEAPSYKYRMLAYVGVLGPKREGRRDVTTVWGAWSPQCSIAERKGGRSGFVVLVEDEGKITAFGSGPVEREFSNWPEGTVLISFITPQREATARRD